VLCLETVEAGAKADEEVHTMAAMRAVVFMIKYRRSKEDYGRIL